MKIPELFRQYIWLIDLIYRERKISLQEINRRWVLTAMSEGRPIPRTTFNRHRESIETMFDINISCDMRDKCYYIEDRASVRMSGVKKWMLDTISVGTIVAENSHLKKRILLENIPSGQEFLTMISVAMRENKTLNVEYQKFGGEPYSFELEPFCLKLYHQRWYLLGHKPGSEHIAVYSLDRINHISETYNSFTLPEGFDAEEYFSPFFGVFKGNDTPFEHVVLHASPRLANYYRTLPLHHSQKEVKSTDEYVEFTVDLCPTYDFRQEILSQMSDVKIISPEWLRRDIHETLLKMLKNYEIT